jgi:hypothetical protein
LIQRHFPNPMGREIQTEIQRHFHWHFPNPMGRERYFH